METFEKDFFYSFFCISIPFLIEMKMAKCLLLTLRTRWQMTWNWVFFFLLLLWFWWTRVQKPFLKSLTMFLRIILNGKWDTEAWRFFLGLCFCSFGLDFAFLYRFLRRCVRFFLSEVSNESFCLLYESLKEAEGNLSTFIWSKDLFRNILQIRRKVIIIRSFIHGTLPKNFLIMVNFIVFYPSSVEKKF